MDHKPERERDRGHCVPEQLLHVGDRIPPALSSPSYSLQTTGLEMQKAFEVALNFLPFYQYRPGGRDI